MMRSLLFAPANRDKFVLNFLKLDADAYCIDLEDGTPAAEKDSAQGAEHESRGLPAALSIEAVELRFETGLELL